MLLQSLGTSVHQQWRVNQAEGLYKMNLLMKSQAYWTQLLQTLWGTTLPFVVCSVFKKWQKLFTQCHIQEWSRCDSSVFVLFLIWEPVIFSLWGPLAFWLIFVWAQILIPSKPMSLPLYHTKHCSIKSFAFHYPLAVFMSVMFLNVMTNFLGIKAPNKFPVICLMHGLFPKAEFLKSKNLMVMLILMPFSLSNFKRNSHN